LNKLIQDDEHFTRVLIFTRTKKNADNVFKYLSRKNEDEIRVIHGNKGQNTRINAINSFREGKIRILVSTDVTARGIDISEISHVINFDIPVQYEDYVHRIGRTGRAGRAGTSITFVNPAEEYHIPKIESLIQQSIPVKEIDPSVTVMPTYDWEKQEMARLIDFQRKKEDPSYQGAFHEKKNSHVLKRKKRNRNQR
jgi:ATP-dependent RNA helicase RhlE